MNNIKNFILHLRLNYNFLILSAPFFLGALYVPEINKIENFIFLFLLLYVFLFGGANAYNSYFDKDEGPIGGLQNPPKMDRWMYYASWFVQFFGLLISMTAKSLPYSAFFAFSIVLFWLYSSPSFRFKGKPLFSFVVIGIGTVINAVLMGYFAAGGETIGVDLIIGALGAAFIILSMYPFSQVYQIDEDRKRGDRTFAVAYGVKGVRLNYLFMFLLGIVLLAYSFILDKILFAVVLSVGLIAYFSIWQVIKRIAGHQQEYKKVMRTKYIGGVFFTLGMIILLVLF